MLDNLKISVISRICPVAFFFFIHCLSVDGQSTGDKKIIREESNLQVLEKIAAQLKMKYHESLNRAARQNVAKEIIDGENQVGYLSGFDSKGRPVYDFDDNIDVARTLRVNKIWQGGSGLLELDGAGIQIGHWEAGGLALSSHQELRNRIAKGESAIVSSHATHTAGTMIGSGVTRSARGMANGAKIISYKSDNDEAELAEFALAGGILSNHSYSSRNPDIDFSLYGQYTENTREWDEILYNAPYLTACKSAGNTRNDGLNDNDNGYDLLFTIANAKNLITVGAVHEILSYSGPESVAQADFSSWGPTDDWRVKPDFVTCGTNVFSAHNTDNTSYDSKSGTSMSAAATTGSIALLQQHYHSKNEAYMRAATVKALLVATTDEAGSSAGPDFQNGWGLLNIEQAAKTISKNGESALIEELNLSNGATFRQEVFIDGTSTVTLAIAWTDPPGTPSVSHDNQQPVLVNDLDVRVNGNGSTFKPWKLSPNTTSNNFASAAVRGDNIRDNVEKIEMGFVSEGTYTVQVTHKNVLTNNIQNFSLVITGLVEDIVGIPAESNAMISVYPVPSMDGLFHLAFPFESNLEECSIQLFNSQGKLISNEAYNKPPSKLDYSKQQSGIYYLKLITDRRTIIKRLQINK